MKEIITRNRIRKCSKCSDPRLIDPMKAGSWDLERLDLKSTPDARVAAYESYFVKP